MLKSFIVQICAYRPGIPVALENLRWFYDVNQQPSVEKLVTAIRLAMKDFSSVYLVIDALDECPRINDERKRLLAVIATIHSWAEPNLHIFATSRNEHDIALGLNSLFQYPNSWVISLEERRKQVCQDMETFISQELKGKSWPAATKENVKDALLEKADGMFVFPARNVIKEGLTNFDRFQYISVQLLHLERANSLAAIDDALKSLPVDLDDTYNRALLQIDPKERNETIRALTWLAFAEGDLTVAELSDAVIIKTCPPSSVSNPPTWNTASELLAE